MKPFLGVVLREILVLEKRIVKQLASMAVSPFLYLIAFGLGVGKDVRVNGMPYMEFLIPGLVTMNAMFHSYAIAVEINISRFYMGVFDEFQVSPLSTLGFVSAEALVGTLRAFIATLLVIAIGYISKVKLHYGLVFWSGVLVTSLLFSFLAIIIAMVVRSHADQALFSSFVITPMAFLGGTFFPISAMPKVVQKVLLLIPLTHSSRIIRKGAYGMGMDWRSLMVLVAESVFLFFLALEVTKRAKD